MTRFQKLATATAAMTLFLIGVGGTVRASGSGLGCPDWPRCHGKWYPPLNLHSIIEYSHRASASIVVALVVITAVYAWVKYRSVSSVFWPAFVAFLIVFFQAFLGALVVKSGLNSHLVVAHFATSLALLATTVTTAVNAYRPRGGHLSPLALLAAGVAAFTVVVALIGAYVTAWGAALVYADWPLFDGKLLPHFGQPNAVMMWVHRVAAAVLGAAIVYLVVRVRRAQPRHKVMDVLAWLALATWALQALAGAENIWTQLASWAVAAHVLGGAALWGTTATLAVVAYRLAPGAGGSGGTGAPAGGAREGLSGGTPGGTGGPGGGPGGGIGSRVRAYFLLTKPRVIELLLITTVPAMVVAAHGWPSPWLLLATLIGGSLAAGGAGAINCFVDRDIDDLMERTAHRPVPDGRIEPPNALVFGVILELLSFAWLSATVNLPAAALAVGATVFYVFIYTIWLKRSSPSNIVIGGAAGAAPVLVGWAAVTGHVALPAFAMFAVIFYWTPPHFWALSMRYTEDYAAAGVPMLPVVQGMEATAHHIVRYTVALVGISLLLYPLGSLGPLYLATAAVLGALFVRRALILQRATTDAAPDHKEAMRLFHFSIAYLSLLFVAMAADRLVGGGGTRLMYAGTFALGAGLFGVAQAAIGFEAWRWWRGRATPPAAAGPAGAPAGL